jgi:hypothetical protein
MGWGMAQALGQALQRAGNTWGTERLDLRRSLEDDKRRAEEHGLRQRVGEKNIGLMDSQLEASTFGLERDRERAPVELEGLRLGNEATRTRTAADELLGKTRTLELSDLEARLNAMPPGYHRDMAQLDLDQRRAGVARDRASTAQSQAATTNLGQVNRLQEIQLQEAMTPESMAWNKPEVRDMEKAYDEARRFVVTRLAANPIQDRGYEGGVLGATNELKSLLQTLEVDRGNIVRAYLANLSGMRPVTEFDRTAAERRLSVGLPTVAQLDALAALQSSPDPNNRAQAAAVIAKWAEDLKRAGGQPEGGPR